MTRAQKIELRNITVELAALKTAIESIRNNAGNNLSTHEDIFTGRTLADIKKAIEHLQGAV